MNGFRKNIIIMIMLLGGVGVLLYPDIASWHNARIQREFVQEFNENVFSLSEEEIYDHFRRARGYNDLLTGIAITDPFVIGSGAVLPAPDYMEILYVDGMMGQIEIPSIDVLLPIFHTTTEDVLNRGVGHIEGTSFPVGGQGSHAVLTGHSGLPHARMFTDLEEIEIGDVFFVRVLDYTLAYKIDERSVVLPHEIETLRINQEADFITLITCTPYAVNSHRLLIRGFRVPYIPGMEEEIVYILGDSINWRRVIIFVFGGVFIVLRIVYAIKNRRNSDSDDIAKLKEAIVSKITSGE